KARKEAAIAEGAEKAKAKLNENRRRASKAAREAVEAKAASVEAAPAAEAPAAEAPVPAATETPAPAAE
ncbi:MAG: 30S ribosomal protein S6, partial [Kiritimatiellae bacterium]|nr:30S ribosomal protein S6 [Kiritimatiellia bacterium]